MVFFKLATYGVKAITQVSESIAKTDTYKEVREDLGRRADQRKIERDKRRARTAPERASHREKLARAYITAGWTGDDDLKGKLLAALMVEKAEHFREDDIYEALRNSAGCDGGE